MGSAQAKCVSHPPPGCVSVALDEKSCSRSGCLPDSPANVCIGICTRTRLFWCALQCPSLPGLHVFRGFLSAKETRAIVAMTGLCQAYSWGDARACTRDYAISHPWMLLSPIVFLAFSTAYPVHISCPFTRCVHAYAIPQSASASEEPLAAAAPTPHVLTHELDGSGMNTNERLGVWHRSLLTTKAQ